MKISLYRQIQILGILSIALSWAMGIPGMACSTVALVLGKSYKISFYESWGDKGKRVFRLGILYSQIGLIISTLFFILFILVKILNAYSLWAIRK